MYSPIVRALTALSGLLLLAGLTLGFMPVVAGGQHCGTALTSWITDDASPLVDDLAEPGCADALADRRAPTVTLLVTAVGAWVIAAGYTVRTRAAATRSQRPTRD